MAPKILSTQEANRLLPRIRDILRELRRLRRAIDSQKVEMDLLEIVGAPKQGISIDPSVTKEMEALNNLVVEFNTHLETLEDFGCQVKDLEQGLVDFFSVREGRLVYLCWKEGEEMIQYWHTLDGGFRGRQPL